MASKSNTLTNAIKSKSKNSLTKSNCFTESEFYMYDNIAMAVKDDFEKTNTSIYRFIPTIEDLKQFISKDMSENMLHLLSILSIV